MQVGRERPDVDRGRRQIGPIKRKQEATPLGQVILAVEVGSPSAKRRSPMESRREGGCRSHFSPLSFTTCKSCTPIPWFPISLEANAFIF